MDWLIPIISQFTKFALLAVSLAVVLRIARVPDFGIFGTYALSAAVTGLIYEASSSITFTLICTFISGLIGACVFLISFLRLHIHSLAASLVFVMTTGSLMYAINGEKATRTIQDIQTYTNPISPQLTPVIGLALTAIFVILVLLVLSTFWGGTLVLSSASPKLGVKLGINPTKSISVLVLLAHFLASVGGCFYMLSTGTISKDFSAEPLIIITVSVVLGEILLGLLMAGKNRNRNTNNSTYKRSGIYTYLSAFGSWFYIVSSLVGVFSYYIIFKILTNFFNVNDYLPLVISMSILLLSYIFNRKKRSTFGLMNWDIHGYKTW